ncbi:MAG: fumarylacetoacetate hydrolase family protein [Henriciella sp.]
MGFVSFEAEGKPQIGLLRDNGIINLSAHIPGLSDDLKTLIASGDLRRVYEDHSHRTPDYEAEDVVFRPVVTNPAKIICVGVNYDLHRLETGRDKSAYPTLFTRFADTLTGHGQPITRPSSSIMLDYEGELALIIGAPLYRARPEETLRSVAGYTCFNDATLRDWQRHTSQFTPGKNFPSTAGLGPALILPQQCGLPDNLRIETRLNEDIMQAADTGQMIFKIPDLLSYISQFTRLGPGDIIATGTPGGVGFKRQPPVFMAPGDIVSVEIETVGKLVNPVGDDISLRL